MGKKRSRVNQPDWMTISNQNFAAVYFDMMDSYAWKQLRGTDIQVYLLLRRRYYQKTSHGEILEHNNGNISLPFNGVGKPGQEGYKEHVSKKTFVKAIDNLVAYGFIKVVRSGYQTRQCNLYAFVDEWKRYGTKQFNVPVEWYSNPQKAEQKRAREKSPGSKKDKP